jgi:VanZ family protein
MRLFFLILSIAYVVAIFFLADSPVVYTLSSYNPHSLLHIPLYAGLAILLVLSSFPSGRWSFSSIRSMGFIETGSVNVRSRLLICAFVAAAVAIVDEIHQTFIPNRDGSAVDVLLDLIGVILVICVARSKLKAQIS